MVGLKANPKRTYANMGLLVLLLPVPVSLQEATTNHISAGDPQTLAGRSGSVSCVVTAPFPWFLVHTRFCLYQESPFILVPVDVL